MRTGSLQSSYLGPRVECARYLHPGVWPLSSIPITFESTGIMDVIWIYLGSSELDSKIGRPVVRVDDSQLPRWWFRKWNIEAWLSLMPRLLMPYSTRGLQTTMPLNDREREGEREIGSKELHRGSLMIRANILPALLPVPLRRNLYISRIWRNIRLPLPHGASNRQRSSAASRSSGPACALKSKTSSTTGLGRCGCRDSGRNRF